MKLVVALEGIDGAGKSRLASYIETLCARHGQCCTRVGRRTHAVDPVVSTLTQLVNEEAGKLLPPAEVLVRLAREYQRARLAAEVPSGVVVFNRFILSALTAARLHQRDSAFIRRELKEIATLADLHATILVQCPPEVAWGRIQARRVGWSPLQSPPEERLRQVAAFMESNFRAGLLTGEQWWVDNSATLEKAQDQVDSYLLPYFE
jgi:thymidylate kinase